MDLQLKGKRALVTGSTAGIGFAIAVELAREGVSTFINGRSEGRVADALDRIRDRHPEADVRPAPGDVGSAEGVGDVIGAAPEVDILVNNAGIFDPKPFDEIPDAEWMRFFEVNVMSGVRLSRHYFPGMKSRNWGRIVFISSESALQIPVEMMHYGMTKTAQLAVARGLAELTEKTGVTVNSVLPGPTMSEGVERFVGQLAESEGISREEVEQRFFRHERPSSILQRFADPAEVASVVAFVCSPRASVINGGTIPAEGGILRSIA